MHSIYKKKGIKKWINEYKRRLIRDTKAVNKAKRSIAWFEKQKREVLSKQNKVIRKNKVDLKKVRNDRKTMLNSK